MEGKKFKLSLDTGPTLELQQSSYTLLEDFIAALTNFLPDTTYNQHQLEGTDVIQINLQLKVIDVRVERAADLLKSFTQYVQHKGTLHLIVTYNNLENLDSALSLALVNVFEHLVCFMRDNGKCVLPIIQAYNRTLIELANVLQHFKLDKTREYLDYLTTHYITDTKVRQLIRDSLYEGEDKLWRKVKI